MDWENQSTDERVATDLETLWKQEADPLAVDRGCAVIGATPLYTPLPVLFAFQGLCSFVLIHSY